MGRYKKASWLTLATVVGMVCMSVTLASASPRLTGAPAARDSGTVHIGFAQADFGNGWYEVQNGGVSAEAKKLGYNVTIVSGNADPPTQISQIQTFITEGVKGLLINPTDPGALAPVLQQLKSAKIPFVLVNSPLDASLAPEAYCYVAENQVENAHMDGVQMATVLKQKYGSKTTITSLLVEGYPGALDAVLRQRGFLAGYASVKGAPKLHLLPNVYGHWSAAPAIAPVESVATANPDLRALFVETDSMMPGVQTALTAAGLWNKVDIASYDGRMAIVKQMIGHPNGPIIATVANHPDIQGKVGVEMLQKAMNGVPKSVGCPTGDYVVPPTLITPATAKSYYNPSVPY